MKMVFLLLMLPLSCLADTDPDQTFDFHLGVIRAEYSADREKLFTQFNAAVKRLRENFISKGDLKNTLEADKVIKAADARTTAEATFPGLPPLQRVLDERLAAIEEAERKAVRKLRQAHIDQLEKQVVALTKAVQIDQAKAAAEALKKQKILLASEVVEEGDDRPSTSPLGHFGQRDPSARGLTIQLYKVQESQKGGDNYNGYVFYKELTDPEGKPRTQKGLIWWKPVDKNAVVSGFLKIDKAGTYGFRTNSDFDRNELIVDGKIVCKFRDGEAKPQSIELAEGLVPIVSAAYVRQTKDTRVHWKPPGQEGWSEIPTELLFHR